MAKRTCSVDGCDRPHRAKGLCSMHWQRQHKTGTTAAPEREQRLCSIDGCGKPHRTGGLCSAHAARLRKHGDPLVGGPLRFRSESGVCSIEGCGRPHVAKGLCGTHRARVKAGRPMEPPTMLERFLAKVDKDGPVPEYAPDLGPCWIWTAGQDDHGYGFFRLDDAMTRAHRASLILLVGPIPDGLHVDHLCRVPLCVRPKHLEAVTPEENMRRGLRGVLKQWCVHGHEYTEANTRFSNGQRICRTCESLRRRKPPREPQTHCVRGHLFDEQNTRLYRGKRICRACARYHAQKRRERT